MEFLLFSYGRLCIVHFGIDVCGFHYRPQRSWGKVMFLQASVILSTRGICSGGLGVPGPGGKGGCLVPERVPGGDPPPGWLLLRAVRILLECIIVLMSFYCTARDTSLSTALF